MLSAATAHANGLPMNVGPCMKQPASPEHIVRAIASVVIVAERVI